MTNQMQEPNRKPVFKSQDYHRCYEVRAVDPDLSKGESSNDMIVEGKAVTFNESTLLFEFDGTKVYEKIDARAFDSADMSDVFLKYNHSEDVMVLARTKNKSLELFVKPDGVYIRAKLPDTSQGHDLFTLIKDGTIDKMSFAFSIQEQQRNENRDDQSVTYTVLKIKKLFDVAAVPLPAYDNTQIYARRLQEVEALEQQLVESNSQKKLALLRQRAALK